MDCNQFCELGKSIQNFPVFPIIKLMFSLKLENLFKNTVYAWHNQFNYKSECQLHIFFLDCNILIQTWWAWEKELPRFFGALEKQNKLFSEVSARTFFTLGPWKIYSMNSRDVDNFHFCSWPCQFTICKNLYCIFFSACDRHKVFNISSHFCIVVVQLSNFLFVCNNR